jgi:hypothetical protein
MEVLGRNRFERRKFVDACVVYQDIELTVSGFGFGEETRDVL